jgi:peptide/nickel transport system permease protein
MLSGIIYGARVSLVVGLAAAITSAAIGVVIGSISGFFGGWVDSFLMRLTELFTIIPRFFLAVVMVALFGNSIGWLIFVIGILSWPNIARVVRGEFLSLREREFVEAARALGFGNGHIIFSEILPNTISAVTVLASLQVAQAILLEAGLSFFGLGDPNLTSWGKLLNDSQRFLRQAWWMSVFPGTAILLSVLGFNLVGDGLNDALNPRLKER